MSIAEPGPTLAGPPSHQAGGAASSPQASAPPAQAAVESVPVAVQGLRASATQAAVDLLASLEEVHGPLLLHQSGGCCDGSSPMCYPRREFQVGQRDVYLGDLAGTPYYIGGKQYEYWAHTHLTLDVVEGRGSGFSLEAPEGVRFFIHSRLFTDDEVARIEEEGPASRGPVDR